MRFRALLLAAFAAALLAPATARAEAGDSVLVQVGGQLASQQYNYVDVPVTVDLRGAPGRSLGGYRLTLHYDPAALDLYQFLPGSFAQPTSNTDSAAYGIVKLTAILPAGASGIVTLFVAHFYVYQDSVPSPITLTVQDLTASAGSVTPFEDLLPITHVVNGSFCRSGGTWGDVDGDGVSNSRDALFALTTVVGLPIDSLANPALADVDGDGKVTSRDALIILSYAVGLDVTGFRIGQVDAGSCATGSATTLTILPDSMELEQGQFVPLAIRATDATGREVQIPNLTWSSSNSSIAAYDVPGGGECGEECGAPALGGTRIGLPRSFDVSGAGVEARGPGVAVLTAEMSPGVRAQVKVTVVAHRHVWYVDVQRALNAPTQNGSAAYPYAFIGDAMDQVLFEGDTVLVAAGNYFERVSTYTSVVLLGDSANRPVIDQRGDPNYSSSYSTVSAGSAGGPMEFAHFTVRGGGVYFEGHDNFVHDVDIQMLGGTTNPLEIYSEAAVPSGSRMATTTVDLGKVRIDRVHITGMPYNSDGILVDQADSAIVTNSTVAADTVFTSGCSATVSGFAGIVVSEANETVIRGNTVTNPGCVGITAFQESGRVVASRNRVTRAPAAGFIASAPVIASDHNVYRNTADSADAYQSAWGIEAQNNTQVDSLISVGDSVIGVNSYYSYAAVNAENAAHVLVDSLVADSIGYANYGYYGDGVASYGPDIVVRHSTITHVVGDGVHGQLQGMSVVTQGNRIDGFGNLGIELDYNCDCVRPAGTPLAVVTTTGGQLLSAGDTITHGAYEGIGVNDVRTVAVSGAVIDSVGSTGIALYTVVSGTVSGTSISRSGTGIYADDMDSLSITGSTLTNNGDPIGVWSVTDSVRIFGTTVDGAADKAVTIDYAPLRIDSSAIINGAYGLYVSTGQGGLVTRTRFQNDSDAVILTGSGGPLAIHASSFAGNVRGVTNTESYSDGVTQIDATGNWWGDANGPRCDPELVTAPCDTTTGGAGDSVMTNRVDFSGFLTSPPITAAPRQQLARLAALPRPRHDSKPARTIPPAPVVAAPARAAAGPHDFPTAFERGRAPHPAHRRSP